MIYPLRDYASAWYRGAEMASMFVAGDKVWEKFFTPLSLFANGEQGVWYDPSDLSSMFQDAAGTIPAAYGQPVGLILDKSGNGNHASQSTATARPTLMQDGEGRAYLGFDGVDDALATQPVFTIANPWFFCAANDFAYNDSASRNNVVEVSKSALNGVGYGTRTSFHRIHTYSRLNELGVAQSQSAAQLINSTYDSNIVTSVQFSSGVVTVWDGTEVVLNTTQNLTDEYTEQGALRLGVGVLTARSIASIKIYGVVAVAAELVSAREATQEFLADKAGVII